MEPVIFDAWEQKVRARYREGAESHRLLAIAADPSTPAPDLSVVYAEAVRNYNSRNDATTDACLIVLEALAAHPNTPPSLLAALIWHTPFSCRAFCRNPLTPFLLLEEPGFVAGLMEQAQHALLREADAPKLLVQLLAGNAAQTEAVRKAARLHVAFAGEAGSQNEWEQELHDYWRAECAATQDEKARQWHADLAEMGFAPTWAVGLPPFPEPNPAVGFPLLDEWFQYAHVPDSRNERRLLDHIGPKVKPVSVLAQGLRAEATPADLHQLLHNVGSDTRFVRMAILRHPSVNEEIITAMSEIHGEQYQHAIVCHPLTPTAVLVRLLESGFPHLRRLARRHPNAPANAMKISRRILQRMARRVELCPSPFVSFVASLHGPHERNDLPQKAEHHHWTERLEAVFLASATDEPIPSNPEGRTGNDLLHHLTRDGSRIVRAAAKTRLANAAYRFSLTTPDDEAIPSL